MVPPESWLMPQLMGEEAGTAKGPSCLCQTCTQGLYQVAASGGDPVPVFKLDPSKYSYYGTPKFLPDGKHFLYYAAANDPASSGAYFASLDGKENRLLLKGARLPTYGSGYLLYHLGKTLMAQAFDPERGQLKGDAHPVAEPVASDSYGNGVFNVSENGVLIYQAGDSLKERRITWFDRAGKELGAGEKRSFETVRISPDGTKIAFAAGDPNNPNLDIWVDELARGVHRRLTNDPGTDTRQSDLVAGRKPDSVRILGQICGRAFTRRIPTGPVARSCCWRRNPPTREYGPPTGPGMASSSFSCARNPPNPVQHQEVWVLPLAGDRKPRLFVPNACNGQFSPDGRWVAYSSMEPGKFQICVVPFDATKVLDTEPGAVTSLTGKYQISASGGVIARWREDGKEIFYYGPNQEMMATEVDGKGNNFEARKEQVLFRVGATVTSDYDVTPDGRRFVMTTQKMNVNAPLTLVVNWTARLANKP